MREFSLLAIVGIAVSIICLFALVTISASAGAHVRYVWILVYVLATVGLFLWAARFMTLHWLVSLGCVIAVSSVFAEQILAFSIFPGLVKDVDAFGPSHLKRLGLIVVLGISWYVAVATVANLIMSSTSWRK